MHAWAPIMQFDQEHNAEIAILEHSCRDVSSKLERIQSTSDFEDDLGDPVVAAATGTLAKDPGASIDLVVDNSVCEGSDVGERVLLLQTLLRNVGARAVKHCDFGRSCDPHAALGLGWLRVGRSSASTG